MFDTITGCRTERTGPGKRRRGWCGCLAGDPEPPEITYCVADKGGGLTLQAVTPSQPMPDQEELNAKFAELVVSIKPSRALVKETDS